MARHRPRICCVANYCKRFAQSAGPGLNTIWLFTFGGFVWIHFLCFSHGLSSVFKHRFWLRKESTFGALFHSRGSFWSNFQFIFGNFFSYFGSCFVLGRTLGALGANFFITKTVWTTKGAPMGFPPKSPHFCWSHFGVILCDLFGFLSSIFKHRFLLSSEANFSWILASFRDHFLYCFGFVGTSGFSVFWQLFHSKTCLASPGVSNLAHFQHVLLTSFQVRFLSDFLTFLRPSGAPFGTIFQKKTLPKIASKKGDPLLENNGLWRDPGAPRGAASYYSL